MLTPLSRAALAALLLLTVTGCGPDDDDTIAAECLELENFCTAVGTSCDGDELVICEMNADGCPVSTTTDCSADGGTCGLADGATEATCGAPCDFVNACPSESYCDDDGTFHYCEEDLDGCLVSVREIACGDYGGTCAEDPDIPFHCVGLDNLCAGQQALFPCEDEDISVAPQGQLGPSDEAHSFCGGVERSTQNTLVEVMVEHATRVSIEAVGPGGLEVYVMPNSDGLCFSDDDCIETEDLMPSDATLELLAGESVWVAVDGPVGGEVVDFTFGFSCDVAECGDGIVDFNEACDDGNDDAEDGCVDCQLEEGWACRDDGCHPRVCGDGLVDEPELCDDGNDQNNDGCHLCDEEAGFACDTITGAEPESMCWPAVCGDGFRLSGHERCDDGNTDDGDGCSSECEQEDGWLCEHSSQGDLEEPSSVCHEVICGDEVIEVMGGESCDDGNDASGDGCSSACDIEEGWACDGEQPSTCWPNVCGDGIIVTGESCDDGNTTDDDGCSGECALEAGFACDDAEPTQCHPIVCGDGLIDAPETCDDENGASADGCTSCAIDAGWACEEEPSICHEIRCGDGIVDATEQCDEGNTWDGDGCSSLCEVEEFYVCFGEPSICEFLVGDTCDTAEPLTEGSVGPMTLLGSEANYNAFGGECGSERSLGPDIVYTVTLQPDETLTVAMDPVPDFDATLAIAENCPNIATTCQAFSADAGAAPLVYTHTGAEAALYYVVVGAAAAAGGGEYTLDVTIE